MPLPDPFNEHTVNIPKRVLSGSVGQNTSTLWQSKNFKLAAIIAIFAALAGVIMSLL